MFGVFCTCKIFAAENADISKFVPAENCAPLNLKSEDWAEIGSLKHFESKDIKDSKLGIGFEALDRKMFDPSKAYDPIAQTGLKWVRCQTGWARTETQKGKYDFAWLDEIVDNLIARGLKPWFNVGYGNPLYMPNVNNPAALGYVPLYYGDECLEAWQNFIAALTEHFKGRVQYFEIWNEANTPHFWQPEEPNPTDYAKLVNLTSAVIKRVNPEAQTGACVSGQMRAYMVGFFKAGGGDNIDFFTMHPYVIMPEYDGAESSRGFKAILRDFAGGKEISLWQGEAGFASYFPPKHWLNTVTASNQQIQAKWILRRIITDLSEGRGLTSIFQAVDFETYFTAEGGGKPAIFGKFGILEAKTYKPKRAWSAIKNLTCIFDCDTVKKDFYGALDLRSGEKPVLGMSRAFENAARVLTFERNNYPLYVYYLAEDVEVCMPQRSAKLKFLEGKNEIRRPVLVDLFDGKVYEYKKPVGMEYYGNVRGIKDMPLTDYPLLFTDFEALKDRIILK